VLLADKGTSAKGETMESMKKKKLQLNRETLMPLDNDQLEGVNGGTLSALVRLSARTCVPASRAVSRASAAASGWVTRNLCPSAAVESAIEATRRLTGGGNNGNQ
jgi:hypothetical protein